MKKLLTIIIFCLLIGSCATDNVHKDDIEKNQRPEHGTVDDYSDSEELQDETIRYTDIENILKFGEPGILYNVDVDNTTALLIDIDKEIIVKFNIREGNLFYNESLIAIDLRPIKRDTTKGITWFTGSNKVNGLPFCLVIEDF